MTHVVLYRVALLSAVGAAFDATLGLPSPPRHASLEARLSACDGASSGPRRRLLRTSGLALAVCVGGAAKVTAARGAAELDAEYYLKSLLRGNPSNTYQPTLERTSRIKSRIK